MTTDHSSVIEAAAKFRSAHDAEKLSALFAENGVFEDMALGVVARGRSDISEFWRGTWAVMPDYTMTLLSVVTDEHRGGAEWEMSATKTGHFLGDPSLEKLFSLRAAAVVTFEAGHILHWSDFWSLSVLKQQLGITSR